MALDWNPKRWSLFKAYTASYINASAPTFMFVEFHAVPYQSVISLDHGVSLERREMAELLDIGTECPDVTFRQGRERVRLLDFKGEKNVVVAFYGAAFTGG